MWEQTGRFQTAGTSQNRNFPNENFSKSATGVECANSHKLLQYFAWRPDHFSQGIDALQ